MSIEVRTHLATLLRQHALGLLSDSDLCHAVSALCERD